MAVSQVLAALDAGVTPDRAVLQRAVHHLLGLLAEVAPGKSIEVRVPPLGAAQCGPIAERGEHRRGTPPNVVECDPITWIALGVGRLNWTDAVHSGHVVTSGIRADLAPWLPLLPGLDVAN